MRLTKRDLAIKIERMNDYFDLGDNTKYKLVLDCAYGGYKVALRELPHHGESDLSGRLNVRECYWFLAGMEKTLELIGRLKGASFVPDIHELKGLLED